METNSQDQRSRFALDVASGAWSMTELCARYGVSRPTGYKWLARARAGDTLADRSRAPHTCPHRMSAAVTEILVALREEYGWGAKKLLKVLARRRPDLPRPARSSVNALFASRGLLRRHRRRTHWPHPGAAALHTTHPNQVWPADFKGHFRTGDGRYCYPLTVTDHFSRALLACDALTTPDTASTYGAFRRLFRAVGLPDAIRTDNGPPFASTALHGLTPLNVWWMQLGITHQRIAPGRPQQNGTHERMHRELKRETTQPAAASAAAQQRRFNAFRHRYNHDRPHEALDDATPATHWHASLRPYPDRLPRPEYASTFQIRRVKASGEFSWRSQRIFLTHALAGHDVALEPVEDDLWNVLYYRTLIGRFDQRRGRIVG